MANPLLKRKPREVSALSAITAALSEAALSEAVVSVPSVVPSVVPAPPPRSSRKRKRNSARRRRARSNSNKPTASFWRTWTICSISSETDNLFDLIESKRIIALPLKLLLHIYFNNNNSTREKERERTSPRCMLRARFSTHLFLLFLILSYYSGTEAKRHTYDFAHFDCFFTSSFKTFLRFAFTPRT